MARADLPTAFQEAGHVAAWSRGFRSATPRSFRAPSPTHCEEFALMGIRRPTLANRRYPRLS
jgi:hypothetical protein